MTETGNGLNPDDDDGDVDDDANDSAYVLTSVKATLVTGSAPLSSPPLHQIPFYLLTHYEVGGGDPLRAVDLSELV